MALSVRFDRGVNKLYIDGEEVASKPATPYLPTTDPSRFGHLYGDFGYHAWLRSPVDEVKIHDQDLSAADIRAHYLEYKAVIDSINAAQP